jgi:hypothetical protein
MPIIASSRDASPSFLMELTDALRFQQHQWRENHLERDCAYKE